MNDGTSTPALGDTLEFLRLIWALDHNMQRASIRMRRSLIGLTGPQRLALRIIGRFPGITSGQLAKILLVHPSTLTGVLYRLQRRGLIVRQRDRSDRRRRVLGLTERGRRLDAPESGAIESTLEKALLRLPAPAILGARLVLERLNDALAYESHP